MSETKACHAVFSCALRNLTRTALLPILRNRESPIPDPVKLLRRLAALESRIDQLGRDCIDVANGRTEIALAVTDIELKNAHILRKVSQVYFTDCFEMMLLHGCHGALTDKPFFQISDATDMNDEDEATTPLQDNWISLASAIEEQHELFSTQDD